MVYTDDQKMVYHDKIESGVDNRFEDEQDGWDEYMQQKPSIKFRYNEGRW